MTLNDQRKENLPDIGTIFFYCIGKVKLTLNERHELRSLWGETQSLSFRVHKTDLNFVVRH